MKQGWIRRGPRGPELIIDDFRSEPQRLRRKKTNLYQVATGGRVRMVFVDERELKRAGTVRVYMDEYGDWDTFCERKTTAG